MRVVAVVNGQSIGREGAARLSLADWLREDLRLTGTHLGCEQGVCGSCTVLVEGQPTRACLMLAVQAHGHQITTVEGVVEDDRFAGLIDGFRQCSSFQCGFCTPGFITTCAAALPELTDTSTDEVLREVLSGNLCRCTGYESIVNGLRLAIGTAHDTE